MGTLSALYPRRASLFLYKLKAERDRPYDLKARRAVMHVERRNWLETKLSKNRSDSIALLGPQPLKLLRFASQSLP